MSLFLRSRLFHTDRSTARPLGRALSLLAVMLFAGCDLYVDDDADAVPDVDVHESPDVDVHESPDVIVDPPDINQPDIDIHESPDVNVNETPDVDIDVNGPDLTPEAGSTTEAGADVDVNAGAGTESPNE